MVGEELINALPSDLILSIESLIDILQIIGGIIGIYVILWTINFFINLRRIKILKRVEEKIVYLDKKLDKIDKKLKSN